MTKTVIRTENAPAAVGAYSQGIVANGMVFTAGQIPINPVNGEMVEKDIKAQTKQSLENVKGVLEAAGSSLANVVKVTVFLADMNDFKAMNEVYGSYFPENPPARSAVQAARLPLDAMIEIEAVALVE